MYIKSILSGAALAFLSISASAAPTSSSSSSSSPASSSAPATASTPTPDKDGKYWIESPGLKAAFVPYGASIANLILSDKTGTPRDVVTGFDTAYEFTTDPVHAHFGGVPGRYANRVRNASFELDGEVHRLAPNDNPTPERPDGVDTLHGGPRGWDYRNFTVVSHSARSVTFQLVDPDGEQGFPGEVVALVTYSLGGADGMTWDIEMVALATTARTPIMLSSHAYWNLDGFANDETALALDHVLRMPYAGSRIDVDGTLIPTGNLLGNEEGGVNDFWSRARPLGESFGEPAMEGNCGAGCVGYDNCYITHRPQLATPYDWRTAGPVATLSSPWSGIQLDVFTDQDALQLYSCNFQDGKTPLKSTQGHEDNPEFPRYIQKYGCVVLEVQDWIDGINHPEWGRMEKQVFGPGSNPYVLRASYKFSVNE